MSLALDTTTKSLEFVLGGAVSANELDFTSYYADKSATTFAIGANDGTSNGGTEVTWVSSPGASASRIISSASIYNNDSAQAVVTIKLNNNGTRRVLFTVTLETGEQLLYTSEDGWKVYDANGVEKVGSGAPTDAEYVVLSTNTSLTQERVLTGTANQITITDNGAGSTVVLSTPQDIATGSTVQFAGINLGHASDTSITRVSAGVIAVEGNNIALVSNNLSVFAETTSAQLAGVISDETGSGALMFATSPVITTDITIPNTGLHILDTNATHDLIIKPGSDLTADRTYTIVTGDSDRTITLSGNPTLADWFDQSVKQAASPTFAG
ncbi:MAG: hypothetical protein H8D23_28925, partial [Candidatus Brocadiales bacterium]|nr:hypothetical protein [Candidatus Brocadiales bacterium]